MEGAVSCPLMGGGGSCPSGGQGQFKGSVDCAAVGSGRVYTACLLIGGAVFFPSWLVGLRCFRNGGC